MAVKRVKVADLQPGMYVHDLNCGWMDHGFFRKRFMIKEDAQIQKMRSEGLSEVYIDTDRGGDVAGAPTQAEVAQGLEQQLKDSASAGPALVPARVPQQVEAEAARKILGEASQVVQGLLHDVRLGKQVDPDRARPLVKAMHTSVLRNPGALISLSRIKQSDTYTFQHSVSIGALMVAFSNAMGLDPATVEEAGLGGLLHDVGKMKVPNEVLNKPGKLTEQEFGVMKSHAARGQDILKGMPGISDLVIRIVGEHHERVSGGGYPLGIAGEQISEIGRMASIVDVYDAITSNRVYHQRTEPTEALKKLLEWSGSHLDADLTQQFIRALGIYPVGSFVHLSNGLLAIVVEQGEDLLRPTVRVVHDITRSRTVAPYDLALSRESEQILDYEDPADWGLSPADFL